MRPASPTSDSTSSARDRAFRGTTLGAVLGLILGALINRGHLIPIDPSIYFIDHLPVLTNPLDAVAVIAASLVIATLAPLYPSVQAARLDPVRAIRYE